VTALAAGAGATLLVAAVLFLVRGSLPDDTLAWASAGFVLVSALYSWRKRGGQELLPGPLRLWLHLHAWTGLLALWAAGLATGLWAGDPLDLATFVALAATVATGLLGTALYARIPRRVADREVRHLALGWTERQAEAARAALRHARTRPAPAPAEAEALRGRLRRLEHRLRAQRRLRFALRAWLWLHLPAATALLALITWSAWRRAT
jgi:hypothetical protein